MYYIQVEMARSCSELDLEKGDIVNIVSHCKDGVNDKVKVVIDDITKETAEISSWYLKLPNHVKLL